MKNIIFSILLMSLSLNLMYSQKYVEMKKINGVYQIPCKVNGIPMNFIFDTGASDVTISLVEAKFLIKQGLLNKEDFRENINYSLADGSILEGTKINLKSIEIGGIYLKNITASVINKQNAPLLLGQSAISKLGTYSINGNQLILSSNQTATIQSEEKSGKTNISEAVNYLNQFLSMESWGAKIEANFTYNSYSNSLSFKSFMMAKDGKDLGSTTTYAFDIDNVDFINETIHLADEKKSGDANVILFTINLKNSIFQTRYKKTNENEMPQYKTEETKKVSFTIIKQLTVKDLESMSKVIRDLFPNVNIITKNL